MTEQLSALDVAFLCLEGATAPMHLGAVAVFDPPGTLDSARLAALLGDRAQQVARMSQRVSASQIPPGSAVWTDDPAFDAGDHIQVHHLRRAGRDDLAALTSELMAVPLDLTRPLWQLHVITGLAGDRFAIMAKLHHALCDGYGAIGLGLGLLDGYAPPPRERATAPQATSRPPYTSSTAEFARGLLAHPDEALGAAIRTATDTVSQAHTMLGIASSVIGNVRVPPLSPLLAIPSRARRVVLASLAMHDLRQIRRRHGGTLNDVLLAVVTGALRQWLGGRGHPLDGPGLRALIPASRRRRPGNGADGNQLSGYLCDLPVSEPDPGRRLALIRAAMDRNKATGARHGPGALPVLAGLLPHVVHRFAAPFAAHAAPLLFDIVISNVTLPAVPLRLDGAELREMYPLVPLASGHALAIAVSPYRDTVHVGLHAARDAVPDIEKLAEALSAAVTELSPSPATAH
jgi:WS/DGAT/MGAT family acyltransferase